MNCNNERFSEFFESVRKYGLKLNKSKCQFDQWKIIFLGHKITAEGVQPDHNKVEEIQRMPYRTDVKVLQRLLGMVNYLSKFLPNLSTHTVHLRKLLEKGIIKQCTPPHSPPPTHTHRK